MAAPLASISTVTTTQLSPDSTGKNSSDLSDHKISKLAPTRSQLREIRPMVQPPERPLCGEPILAKFSVCPLPLSVPGEARPRLRLLRLCFTFVSSPQCHRNARLSK